MRKLALLLPLLLLLLMLTGIPGFAQTQTATPTPQILTAAALTAAAPTPGPVGETRTLPQFVSSIQSFNTLTLLLTQANLVGRLNEPGPFTLFAPTNDAFNNLDSSTAALIQSNPETLATILASHVVSGNFTLQDLQRLNGQTLTTLTGAPLSISAQGGAVSVNGVALNLGDFALGNGMVYPISAVLVPPQDVLVPPIVGPTSTPTVTPTSEATSTPTPLPGFGGEVTLRVAHFSPDAPAVDVYLNGERVISKLEFPGVSAWATLPNGFYNIALAPADAGIENAVLTLENVQLATPEGARLTLAAIGSAARQTLQVFPIVEDYRPMPPNTARLTVFHAIEGAPAVDVRVDGGAVVPGLSYPGTLGNNDGTGLFDLLAQEYDLAITRAGNPMPLLEAADTTLTADTFYLIAAVGTADAPELFITTTRLGGEIESSPTVAATPTPLTAILPTATPTPTVSAPAGGETAAPAISPTVPLPAPFLTATAEAALFTPTPEAPVDAPSEPAGTPAG